MAISVRAGIIHHAVGEVTVNGEPVKIEFGHFPMVGAGSVLSTKDGRAEVGLTPGVVLRLDRNSSFKMLSTAVTNTQVELESGVALVEVLELFDENHVRVRVGEAEANILKTGLYRFDANSGRIQVYDGKAEVAMGGKAVVLKKGRETVAGSSLVAAKFDRPKDALYAWSSQRASLTARINTLTASGLQANGYRLSASSWAWNSMYNMWTFLPLRGYLRSPFGWGYYSPRTVWQAYTPRPTDNGGGFGASRGWSGMSAGRNAGYSGSDSGGGFVRSSGAATAPAAAPAASAPVSAPAGGRGR